MKDRNGLNSEPYLKNS